MEQPNFVEKPKNTQLETWQLGDLVLSNMRLLDVDPADGTSSIMEGLSHFEYGAAMAIRRVITNDEGRAAGYWAGTHEQYELHRARAERAASDLDRSNVSS